MTVSPLAKASFAIFVVIASLVPVFWGLDLVFHGQVYLKFVGGFIVFLGISIIVICQDVIVHNVHAHKSEIARKHRTGRRWGAP